MLSYAKRLHTTTHVNFNTWVLSLRTIMLLHTKPSNCNYFHIYINNVYNIYIYI